MTKISEYPVIATPELDDLLIGTDANNSDITKNFSIGSLLALVFSDVPSYADNAAAITGGLVAGEIYRTGDILKVVHD